MYEEKNGCSENWRLLTAPAVLPRTPGGLAKVSTEAPLNMQRWDMGRRGQHGASTLPWLPAPSPVLQQRRGQQPGTAAGQKKILGPADQGRETHLAEAWELPRRGLLASPFPSRPLDGPCCYLADKCIRKGMERSNRIKIYFEMT